MSLIVTKLRPPLGGKTGIRRERLLSRLVQEDGNPLILVTAPAGFGKSTFLLQTYRHLEPRGHYPCWLSLGSEERVPRAFLRYIIGALQTRAPDVGNRSLAMLETQSTPDIVRIVGHLINDISADHRRFVLLLDDYHLAHSPEVDETLLSLISLAPPNLSLVIASRERPDIPLAALRMAGSVQEITQQDLRFDEHEAGRFLREVQSLDVTDDQALDVARKTEGWAAGIQLAGLTLNAHGNEANVIDGFDGSVRDVADYLAATVLDRLPADMRDFLMLTSPLHRINADLCNTLLDRADGQARLEEVEALNLFLIPLDDRREWFRYHHLFRDFLLARLDRSHPDRVAPLYFAAFEWFRDHGFTGEAVGYALDGGFYDAAAEIVEKQAIELMKHGRMPELANWINRLPEKVITRKPRLPLLQCGALFHMRRHEEAAATLLKARTIIDTLSSIGYIADPEEEKSYQIELRMLEPGITICRDQTEETYRLSAELLPLVKDQDMFIMGRFYNIYGYGAFAVSDFEKAETYLLKGMEIHKTNKSPFGVFYSLCFLGQTEIARGRLRQAMAYFEEAETIAQDYSGKGALMPATITIYKAAILYEGGATDGLYKTLDGAWELTLECSHADVPNQALILMGHMAAQEGRYDDALHLYEQAVKYAREDVSDRLVLKANLARLRLLLAQDQVDSALRLLTKMGIGLDEDFEAPGSRWDRIAFLRELFRIRTLMAMKRTVLARSKLTALRDIAAKAGRDNRLVELLCLSALLEDQDGQDTAALEHLAQALALSRGQGYVRTFADEGAPMRQLLGRAMKEGAGLFTEADQAHMDVIRRHMTAAPTRLEPRENTAAPADSRFSLNENLSGRENEVLSLLALGKSNRIIADELDIAENTVKWHLKNIFEKIGASNRTEAVLAARALQLVR